ncbi:unnamed protein product, partial [marine sediment metagenome]
LKINVDLTNTKPKQLPDAFTYKPQQPYMGGAPGGIELKLIKEDTVYLDRNRGIVYDYVESNGIMKVYILIREEQKTWGMGGMPADGESEAVTVQFNILYEDGKYKFWVGEGSYMPVTDSWTEMRVHYKIYEVIYNFGDLKLLT